LLIFPQVKLIDFGSAIIEDADEPRPYHDHFYGTTAYAASEIMQKKRYQAPPAEIWTLGVLLSYLLTGRSPFPVEKDAIEGNIVVAVLPGVSPPSELALDLMQRCLHPDPEERWDIEQVRGHPWLEGALDEDDEE
jgi:PAS domain-containing serine/threonine kinase